MEDSISGFATFLQETLMSYATSFAEFFKQLLGALIILLIGWIIAKIVSKTVKKLLQRIDLGKLLEKSNLTELFGDKNLTGSVTIAISKFIYYFIFLIFLLTATEALGMQAITDQVQALVEFFPKILVAVIIFIIGFYIASFIRDIIVMATKSMGAPAGMIIGNAIFYFLLIMISVTAIEQLGIDTSLITSNISIVIAGLIIGGAISYGFAARDAMGNILSTFFAKRSFIAGQVVRIGNVEGQIIEINSTNIVVQQDNNERIVIPTKRFVSENVAILQDAPNTQ